MAYSKIILNGETLMDVTSDTVDAGNLLSGKTATKNSGAKVTGNIVSKSSSDLTASGATVTAPAGYYSTAASKAVTTTTHPNPTAAIASSTGVVTATHTQGTGYVTGGTTTGTLNLTTQAAQTIYPSTANQTIASRRWLTGTQTIKSVVTTNIVAPVIKSGVTVKVGTDDLESRIIQVTGTYAPATSSLTVTPTETAQTFNATGVYGYKPVTINGISSTYVGTGIARKSSTDTTFTSTNGTFTAPIGYYSAAATKTLTTQAAQTIYPSTADQTITAYRWLTGTQTIKSVTTSNLTAENIAEGVVVKIGDATNASRIAQVTGTHQGGGNDFIVTLSQDAYGSLTIDKTFSEIISACKAGKKIAAYGDGSPYYTGSIYVDDEDFYFVDMHAYSFSGDYLSAVFCEDEYGLESNFSAFVSTTYYYNPANMNATPSDVVSGKRFINWAGFQVGTATGGGFTADQIAMRTIAGDISGSATNINSYAFAYCSTLTTASFPNVTTIGSAAFSGCITLTTVSFPNVISIKENAFRTCSALTAASFPNATSVGNYAFAYCSALTIANFSNLSFISDYVFRNCSALTTVSFPSATSTGTYAFQYCSVLSTISFPNMTIIGAYTFGYCYKLTTISFPGVTSIGSQAFQYCSALTTVSFPKVITIGSNAFSHCSALTTVSFPSVVSIFGSAFQSCYNLLSFYLLGSSVPTLSTSVFYYTPIGGFTASTGGVYGSIFVPSSLYNQYIVATNWSDISARIVSV